MLILILKIGCLQIEKETFQEIILFNLVWKKIKRENEKKWKKREKKIIK